MSSRAFHFKFTARATRGGRPTCRSEIDLLSRRSAARGAPRSHALLRASRGPGRRARQRGYQSSLHRTLERATRPADSLRGARRRGPRRRRDARRGRGFDPRTRHARCAQRLRGVSRLSLRDRQLWRVAVVSAARKSSRIPSLLQGSRLRYRKRAARLQRAAHARNSGALSPDGRRVRDGRRYGSELARVRVSGRD